MAIRKGDVVYCDIPYDTPSMSKNGKGYNGIAFDHAAFREWALSRDFPVFVSEYSMPDGFTCIAAKTKTNNIAAKGASIGVERIYVQTKFAAQYHGNDMFWYQNNE